MVTLSRRAFPKAIVHMDADAFFASVEQARNPALQGKPVVTGKERGIASAVSYEGKALGITRGMTTREIKRICPAVVHLPSDYETYSLYSTRMFSIMRRHTALVEEYSIDEAFAELTGLRRSRQLSYAGMASRIKEEIERALGITVSVGLAPSKVVAKIASKWNKPSGFTVISGHDLPAFLRNVPVGDVWGIGAQTTAYLAQFKIHTALDLAGKDEGWVTQHLTKPHVEVWHELRGNAVLPLDTEPKHDYQSISKTKTFTPPSNDRDVVFAQLSKNIENACIKARRYHLVARRVTFLLRTQDFRHRGLEVTLTRATAFPNDIVRIAARHFDALFDPRVSYRLTGVVLSHLTENHPTQLDLFEDALRVEKLAAIYDFVDALDRKYGKHTVFLGSSMAAITGPQHAGERAEPPARTHRRFPGETARKRVGLPMLGEVR